MPEPVKGRFKSHRRDDSLSLFNRVIYFGKLIWDVCVLFLLRLELSKQECLSRLKTSRGLFLFRERLKRVHGWGESSSLQPKINSLYAAHPDVFFRKHSDCQSNTKQQFWNEWQCQDCSAGVSVVTPFKRCNSGLQLGTADFLLDLKPGVALQQHIAHNIPALSTGKPHVLAHCAV